MTTPNQPEHSVEPWSYTGEDDGDFIVWSGEDFVGNIGAAMQRVGVIIDLDRANARRIVACVNACAGVDNATLERVASGAMQGSEIFEQAKRIATLERQRGELVEALKAIRDWPMHRADEISEIAARALAKAESGK